MQQHYPRVLWMGLGLALLLCGVAALSYWMGFQRGQRAGPGREMVFSTTVVSEVPPPLREQRAKSFRDLPPTRMFAGEIPARGFSTAKSLIDLSAWYNASLVEDWHRGGADSTFTNLPTGVHTFVGTDYDVRGLIQLRATDKGTAAYPRQINGITLGLKARKLHFLHNTLFGRLVPKGQEIGAYIILYGDGQTVRVPLRMGENILDWFDSPVKLPPEGTTVVAWSGENDKSRKRGQKIHLNKFTWENPRPEVELLSFDYVGEAKTAGVFLVAVTAEQ